ncbi:MAG: OmpH family outer membrane protein [Nitrospirae bacterium]|nr:OmpH family outer membrane protein [Nitrospirota bacterium]
MRRLIASILVVSGLLLGYCGVSGAADIKIGYVDFQKVQGDSKAGKDIIKSMETMLKDKQAQLDKRQDEIEKMMQEIEKQSSVLSSDVRKQKEEKLQKEYKDLQRFKSDSEEDLNKKKAELLKQMVEEIASVINKYGKEEGYTLILERSVVLYAPEAVDITDRIVKAYDATK